MSNRWKRKEKALAIAAGICAFSLAIKQATAAIIISSLIAYSSGGAISNTETAWTASDKDVLAHLNLSDGQEVLYGGTQDRFISLGQSGVSSKTSQDARDIIAHEVESQIQSEGIAIHEDSAFSQADGKPLDINFCDAGQLALMQGEDPIYEPWYSEDVSSRETTITTDLQFQGMKSISQIDETPDTVSHQYEQAGNGTYTDYVRTRSRIGTDSNTTDLILDQLHNEHNVLNGTFDMTKNVSFSSFKTAFREET